MQRQAGNGLPIGLGLHAQMAAFGGGGEGGILGHPFALVVAVDASGGKVACPIEPGGDFRDLIAVVVERRVAILVRAGGDKQVRGLGKSLGQVAIGPEHRDHAFGAQGLGLICAAGGAVDAPALWDKAVGKGTSGIAVAEGEKCFGHGR
jgi:hypothetical protein